MVTAFDNRDTKRTAITLIVIIVVIILILAFLFGGATGLFGVIKFFITASLIIGFFAFVFYVVWFIFFKKTPRNIPYENWKSYLKSARDNGSDMMEEMILTGDASHSAKRFMTIKGYLRIKAFDGLEYDFFVGKRSSMNFMEDWKIVVLKPDQHTDLIGDVYVYGISLIMKYGYYFVNSTMLDFDAIDKTVAMDTYRTLMYETLGDMKGLLDRATGLDAEFRKEQLQSKLLKIPVLSGQQQQQQQNNQQ